MRSILIAEPSRIALVNDGQVMLIFREAIIYKNNTVGVGCIKEDGKTTVLNGEGRMKTTALRVLKYCPRLSVLGNDHRTGGFQ